MNKSAAIKAVAKAYGKPIFLSKYQYVAYVPYDKLDGPTTQISSPSYRMLLLRLACRKAVDVLVLMGHNADDVDYLVNCEHQFGSNFRQMVHGVDRYLKGLK